MDVLTPSETAVTRRSLRTVAVAVALSALLVVPGVFLPAYASAGATVVPAFVAEFVCRDPSVYVTSTDPERD